MRRRLPQGEELEFTRSVAWNGERHRASEKRITTLLDANRFSPRALPPMRRPKVGVEEELRALHGGRIPHLGRWPTHSSLSARAAGVKLAPVY